MAVAPVGVIVLVAEEDHQAVHKRVMHLLELLVPERIGQVDATDFCAVLRWSDRSCSFFLEWVNRRLIDQCPSRKRP
jgi:hypothetical protein